MTRSSTRLKGRGAGDQQAESSRTKSDKRIDDVFRSKRLRSQSQKPGKENSQQQNAGKQQQQSSKKQHQKSKPKAATAPQSVKETKPKQRTYLDEVEYNGLTYTVGCSAYVVVNPETAEEDWELETCEVCNETSKKRGRKEVPMLECDKCLRGYHLDCLDPPLNTIPEGDWLCHNCASGLEPPKSAAKPGIARQKLMNGDYSLTKIEALWQEADGSTWFNGRWYCLPEETHTGRQKHHAAREVFLTDSFDNNEVECLDEIVPVCLPGAEHSFSGYLDVYVCEYEYDHTWQRFKKRADEDGAQLEGEWSGSDDSESGNDQEYSQNKPIYAFWAEKGLIRPQNMRRSQTLGMQSGRKRRIQGGNQVSRSRQQSLFDLGTTQIPESTRRKGSSLLCKARAALALTTTPTSMPCRDSEQEKIAAFVRECIQTGTHSLGKCLYVSGVPGTGKTASVLEVMRKLRKQVETQELPNFQFVELNSLRLPSPQHLYTHLYEALTGRQLSPGFALNHLEELFNGQSSVHRRRGMTVMLVDEVDLLVTRSQQVLYNLFEWPTRKASRLAVIAVANTMDLPERLLPRIASRLGGRRLAFQPYNRQQLTAIVNARLKDAQMAQCFADNAINMACSKVAGVSGDVRRVLQLCRKAAEICEEEECSQVAMRHINAAVEEMFNAVHMQMLVNCCRSDKLLLASLLLELRAKGRSDAVLQDVGFRLHQMLQVHSEPQIPFGDCLAAARRLGASRLLLTELGGKRLGMRLSLNMPFEDVVDVLQREEAVPWLKNLNF